MSTKEKFKQINREAKASFLAVAAIVVFWFVAGIGVSKLNITIGHTPLWVITGCIGTWAFAVVTVIWLMRHVYKDFDLDEEGNEDEE